MRAMAVALRFHDGLPTAASLSATIAASRVASSRISGSMSATMSFGLRLMSRVKEVLSQMGQRQKPRSQRPPRDSEAERLMICLVALKRRWCRITPTRCLGLISGSAASTCLIFAAFTTMTSFGCRVSFAPPVCSGLIGAARRLMRCALDHYNVRPVSRGPTSASSGRSKSSRRATTSPIGKESATL
jgi:hypothetical protein